MLALWALANRVAVVVRLKPFDTSTAQGRSKERYRRLALTSMAAAVAKGTGILTVLISVPLTLNYLGTERYGLWMTISSVITMLSFADMGVSSGLVNAISEADSQNDRKTANAYVSSAFFMLLGIAAVIVAVFTLAYRFIPWPRVFNVTSDLAARESGPTMTVFVVSFAVNMPLGIVHRVQMGYQEGFKSHLWTSAGGLMGLAGVLLAIHFKAGLMWLVLAMAGGPALATLLNWLFQFVWSRPWLFPRWKAFNWSTSRKVAGIGMLFLILNAFALIGSSSDNIVIAQVLGTSAVSSYAVTKKLFLPATMIQSFFVVPLWPAFGEAMGRSDYVWVRRTLNRSLLLSMGIAVAVAFPLVVFGKQITALWVGKYLVPSTFLLIGFALWVLLGSYGGPMSSFLNHGSLLGRQVVFFGAASTVSLILKIVLAHRWQASGVIWASVLGYGLLYVIPAARLAYGHLRSHQG